VTRLVLLDALGTILAMDPPAPGLTRALADAGHAFDDDVVAAALRIEIAHYRSRMHIGADPPGLRALRAECGAVLARALAAGAANGAPPPDPALATELLVEALRFRLYDDVLPLIDELEARGIGVGVVSNWDCALPAHLDGLGVADRFRVIVASAAVGHAKPDAAIFRHALVATGVDAADALHVGDRAEEDYAGARSADLRALLLDRSPGARSAGDVITSLAEVPGRLTG
jgi:putative hydrolase of the HAD superfamily